SQIPGEHVAEVPSNHHRSYKRVLFPAIGALVTGLSVTLLVVLILLIRRKCKELEKIEGINPLKVLSSCVTKGQEGTSTIFGRFSYAEMRRATRNFSTTLGGNDNATIFKGQLSNGSVVAIKRIESSPKQDQLAFCKEMEFLGRLHHRHLVGLKGYCLTKFERFQVYEYMENGSLKDHLHSSGKLLLPWKNRIQIAIDVANALEYLHFYCDPPLYHGDIKPSNVLLDKNYLAKFSIACWVWLLKWWQYHRQFHPRDCQDPGNSWVRRPRLRGDPGADGQERRVQLRRAAAGARHREARGAGRPEPRGVVPRAHRHRLPPPRAGGPGGGGHVRPGRAAGDGGRDPLVHPQGRRGAAVDEAGPPDPLRAAGPAVRRVRARRGGRAGVLLRRAEREEGERVAAAAAGWRRRRDPVQRRAKVPAVVVQHVQVPLQPHRAAGGQLAGAPVASPRRPRRVLRL
uniref:non-specific serine/threonine protein kinase n=1 Tax=Aegilops tauschii subsp. strangulata TaxID=200361 RepID=A0A453BZH2_AEGTS